MTLSLAKWTKLDLESRPFPGNSYKVSTVVNKSHFDSKEVMDGDVRLPRIFYTLWQANIPLGGKTGST